VSVLLDGTPTGVNGVVITAHVDADLRHAAGQSALRQHYDGSVVEYETVEVRVLG